MNIDELWEKYSVEKFVKDSKLPFRLMDKIGFTEAIGEIISNPVEAEVSQENGGQDGELFIIDDGKLKNIRELPKEKYEPLLAKLHKIYIAYIALNSSRFSG